MSPDASVSPHQASLVALQESVSYVRDLVGSLDAEQLTSQSYASEWKLADVLSHLGSGAVIMKNRVDEIVAGAEPDGDFSEATWDVWNAKSPAEQAADFLLADQAYVDRLGSLTPAEQAAFEFPFGPLILDLDGTIRFRLNEHLVHTWDVEVALDPAATLQAGPATVVVDNLQIIGGFVGQATGADQAVTVRTTEPARDFNLTLGPDAVQVNVAEGAASGSADLTLPAEAFIRLVYGRLDAAHTPEVAGADHLDTLRTVFPGF